MCLHARVHACSLREKKVCKSNFRYHRGSQVRVSAPVRHDVTDDVQHGDGAGENAESVDTDRRRASGGHGQPLHLHLRHGGLDVATGTAVAVIR